MCVRERQGVETKGRERKGRGRKGREPGGKINFGLYFCEHCIMYQALYQVLHLQHLVPSSQYNSRQRYYYCIEENTEVQRGFLTVHATPRGSGWGGMELRLF